MRRFSLVGAVLLLLTGSASAQQMYKVTDRYDCRTKTKTTTIERVDGTQIPPPCPPKSPLCCLLPDQPALLYRLSVMNALNWPGMGNGLPNPRLDCPSRGDVSALLVWLGLDSVLEVRSAATAVTLRTTEWNAGRGFTDDADRRWTLLKGCALPDKLPRMRGWLLECDNQIVYFVHESGNIYKRTAKEPLP